MSGSAVLLALKERWGEFVSGEELARACGVSRAAIWKRITQLRLAGYEIEASTRLGYRLVSAPDLLLPEELAWKLDAAIVGRRVIHFDEIGSTNEEAKSLAVRGAEDGTVVVAEVQTGGRGRLGRGWFSPRGGIWLSLVLRPRIAPADSPKVMMLAASSVIAALRTVGVLAEIKWPNDIVVRGKKIAGILTEVAGQPEVVDHVVVGIGINVNIHQDEFLVDLLPSATSVSLEVGWDVDRVSLARSVLREIDSRYRELVEGRLDDILSEWRSACSTLGRSIGLRTGSGDVRGRAVDVDERGSLILEAEDGSRRAFAAGEVTIIKE